MASYSSLVPISEFILERCAPIDFVNVHDWLLMPTSGTVVENLRLQDRHLIKTPKGESNALSVKLASKNLKLSSKPGSIARVVSEMGKSMPETFPGEHTARIKALVAGDALERKLEAFRIFAYQLANNL